MGNQVVTTIENASFYGHSPTDGRLAQTSHFKTVRKDYVIDVFTIATPLSTSTFAYDPATLATDTEAVSHDIDLNGTPLTQ